MKQFIKFIILIFFLLMVVFSAVRIILYKKISSDTIKKHLINRIETQINADIKYNKINVNNGKVRLTNVIFLKYKNNIKQYEIRIPEIQIDISIINTIISLKIKYIINCNKILINDYTKNKIPDFNKFYFLFDYISEINVESVYIPNHKLYISGMNITNKNGSFKVDLDNNYFDIKYIWDNKNIFLSGKADLKKEDLNKKLLELKYDDIKFNNKRIKFNLQYKFNTGNDNSEMTFSRISSPFFYRNILFNFEQIKIKYSLDNYTILLSKKKEYIKIVNNKNIIVNVGENTVDVFNDIKIDYLKGELIIYKDYFISKKLDYKFYHNINYYKNLFKGYAVITKKNIILFDKKIDVHHNNIRYLYQKGKFKIKHNIIIKQYFINYMFEINDIQLIGTTVFTDNVVTSKMSIKYSDSILSRLLPKTFNCKIEKIKDKITVKIVQDKLRIEYINYKNHQKFKYKTSRLNLLNKKLYIYEPVISGVFKDKKIIGEGTLNRIYYKKKKIKFEDNNIKINYSYKNIREFIINFNSLQTNGSIIKDKDEIKCQFSKFFQRNRYLSFNSIFDISFDNNFNLNRGIIKANNFEYNNQKFNDIYLKFNKNNIEKFDFSYDYNSGNINVKIRKLHFNNIVKNNIYKLLENKVNNKITILNKINNNANITIRTDNIKIMNHYFKNSVHVVKKENNILNVSGKFNENEIIYEITKKNSNIVINTELNNFKNFSIKDIIIGKMNGKLQITSKYDTDIDNILSEMNGKISMRLDTINTVVDKKPIFFEKVQGHYRIYQGKIDSEDIYITNDRLTFDSLGYINFLKGIYDFDICGRIEYDELKKYTDKSIPKSLIDNNNDVQLKFRFTNINRKNEIVVDETYLKNILFKKILYKK